MEEKDFYYENLTCFSIELHWKDRNKEKDANYSYEYELIIKEDNNAYSIYKGEKTIFKVKYLKPNKTYIFKLRIYKSKKYIKKIKIEVTTLNAPLAILSKYREEIANGKNIQFKDKLTESQIKIINNCSKLIFEEKIQLLSEAILTALKLK